MLTEIYIEALLVDEELAYLVWEYWDAGEIAANQAVYLLLMVVAKNQMDTWWTVQVNIS